MGGWALGLLALCAFVAFGVRAALHRRRTGSFGIRGLQGDFGRVEWMTSVLLVSAAAGIVVAPLLDIVGLLAPVASLEHAVVRTTGLVLYGVGLAATFGAQLAMGDAWRVGVARDEKTGLVTDGPFAHVRNPIYTAMFVTLLGTTLLVPNVVALASWLAVVVGLELHVRVVEEPHLLRLHGSRYAEYAARVGRFLPHVGRWPKRGAGMDDAGSPATSSPPRDPRAPSVEPTRGSSGINASTE